MTARGVSFWMTADNQKFFSSYHSSNISVFCFNIFIFIWLISVLFSPQNRHKFDTINLEFFDLLTERSSFYLSFRCKTTFVGDEARGEANIRGKTRTGLA